MPKITGNQRQDQAHLASQNIHREARRIASERGISEEEGVAAVFKDPELLARCHSVPSVESIDPKWMEPK